MVDLTEILKKTQPKYEQAREKMPFVRQPVSIVADDRPDRLTSSPANTSLVDFIPPALDSIKHLHKMDEETIKGTQRSYKGDTNRTQREHKGATERATKGLQREHKRNTKGTPKGPHKGLHKEYRNSPLFAQTKGPQREHKYSHIKGWNKKIVDLIHDICRETVSKVTYPLTNNAISEMLDIPKHTINTTMQRLKNDGHVIVIEFNSGRGGWSKYTLPEEYFTEIPQTKRITKGDTKESQRSYKGNTKGATQGATNVLSSSSSLKDLKTTTIELDEEWAFDITPYNQIGFGKTQIKQLISLGTISASDVEQSLIEFAYDMENGGLPRMKGNKINFLMGLLRKGQSYISEGFINEQEAAISEMSRRAEAKRKDRLKAEFGAWEGSLSDEDRKRILNKMPLHLMTLEKSRGISHHEVRQWYFDYFIKLPPADQDLPETAT
jgi:biotin operon repressor